jgi:NADH-quinone oxidoreductase subunit E
MSETSIAAAAEPTSFAFDPLSDEQIAIILKRYPPGRQASAVIPVLYVVQKQMGRLTGSAWVPRVAMDAVAALLEMPPIRVYEVATFYLMFNTKPIGRFHLQVCTTTPCWLRGSDDVVAACKRATGIQHMGETSVDGLFTMTEVECLGACVNAPMVLIWKDTYEDLTKENFGKVLDGFASGNLPTPGPQNGRQFSAPIGGPTTLKEST